jgi:WD40 repeat protein
MTIKRKRSASRQTNVGLNSATLAVPETERNQSRTRALARQEVIMRTTLILALAALLPSSIGRAQTTTVPTPKPVSQRPSLHLQQGHSASITGARFSADGRWIVTCGTDETARLWEVATGREVRVFRGHRDMVLAVALSGDGRWLTTRSGGTVLIQIDEAADKVTPVHPDVSVRMWNAATGETVRSFKGTKDQDQVFALSPDGKRLAIAAEDNVVRVLDATSGKQLRQFNVRRTELGGATISDDAKWLASADSKGVIGLWDLETGRHLRSFRGRTGQAPTSLSSNGKRLVTASWGDEATVWDVESGRPVQSFKNSYSLRLPVIAPDGNSIIIFDSDDRSARLRDVATGKTLHTLAEMTARADGRPTFSHDSRLVAFPGDEDSTLYVWDILAGKPLRHFTGKAEGVRAVALSADGKRLATASGNAWGHGAKNAQLWDLESGKQIRVFKGHTRNVRAVALSADGKRLFSGGEDSVARLWDTDTARELRAFKGHTGTIPSVAMSRDGKWLVSASGESGSYGGEGDKREFSARVWDANSGAQIAHCFDGHRGFHSVTLSPDNKWVAAASNDGKVRLFEASTGKQVHAFVHAPVTFPYSNAHTVTAALFSPSGKQLITVGWDVRMWDSETHKPIRDFKGNESIIWCAALSNDGKWLATGDNASNVRIWNAATSETKRILKGNGRAVDCVSFSIDGEHLVTGGDDGVRIWNLATGQELCRLVSFRDGRWVVFDAEGRYDADQPGSVDGLHWVAGMQIHSVSEFRDRFHDPGLLAKHLGFHRERPRKIAQVAPLIE